MATQKKYVSLEKLGLYDDKIKKVIGDGDAAALASAKEYANSLAGNYDVAGAAKTVQDNLDAEILRAKGEEARIEGLVGTAQGEVDALELVVEGKADKTALEGFQGTVASTYETKVDAGNKLTEAKTYTDTEVKKVQDEVDALEVLVGDVVEGSTVVEMIGAVEAIADENAGAIDVLEGKVEALEAGTYDDAEVRGLIAANAEAIEALEGEHATDKKALEDAIVLKADITALEEEVNRAKGVEGGLEDRIETMEAFWEAAKADGDEGNVIDTLKEIQEYIAGDETGASEMLAKINQNTTDIEALEGRMDGAEEALGTVDSRIEAAITGANLGQYALDSDLDAAVERIAALETADGEQDTLLAGLRTDVDGKASQGDLDVVAGRVTVNEGAIAALQAKFGEGEGSVEDLIADAKQEAIDAAAGDATTKANKALEDAKSYADGLNTTMDGRVGVLETASATHALKSEVEAVSGRVTTLEGKVGTLETEMDAVEALAAANKAAHEANASAIALKASQADLEALQGRVTAVETWQANMIECSEEDINGLFA